MTKTVKRDHRKALNLKISGLRFFGFWSPELCAPFYMKLIYHINHFAAIVFITLYSLSVIMDLVININHFSILVEDTLFLIIVFMVVFKLYIFKSKHNRIKTLTEAVYGPLDIFRQSSNEKILTIIEDTLYYEYILDNIVEWLVIGLDVGLLSVLLINFGELPLRGAFPFDTSHFPFYIIAIIIQMGTASIFSITIASMNELIFSYIRWINSQLRILILAYKENSTINLLEKINNLKSGSLKSLRNSNSDETSNAVAYKLKICFKNHHYLNDIIAELNLIFNSTMLVQVTTSCCMICLTCFQLVMGKLKNEYKLLFFLGGALTELFNFCWFGSELIFVSDCISDGVWSSGWEKTPNTAVKSLMLMSTITAKNPLELRAGSFFAMSLETFITVLRNAYSFFILLTSMNE